MHRLIAIFVAAVMALQAAISQADSVPTYDIPGEDDPRLQQAIDAYLDGETLDSITELAALARDGNVAARLLLWRLEYRSYRNLPDLSGEERWRLYRAPSDGRRPKSWWPTKELRELPIVKYRGIVREEQDPEVWLAHARRMVVAGEREYVLASSQGRVQRHPYLAGFLDEVTTIDDFYKLDAWLIRWFAQYAADRPPGFASEMWLEGWSGPPWGAAQEAAVREAFREKRLVALWFQRARNSWPTETLPPGGCFSQLVADVKLRQSGAE